jgi:hypothetical protein
MKICYDFENLVRFLKKTKILKRVGGGEEGGAEEEGDLQFLDQVQPCRVAPGKNVNV